MTKGRTPPALPTYTFKDTGITVKLRKLSPFMGDQIGRTLRKEREAPQAPVNMVQYGDGKPIAEPNLADPAYQRELANYENWVAAEAGKRMMELIIRAAIVIEDVDEDEVARVREVMEAVGAPIDPEMSDREVYIRFVCVGTQDDLEDLMGAATRRSQPTEAAIAENVAAFRSDVS
jgi:hypothetical protein